MPRYLLDENIMADERRKLEAANLLLHQVGIEVLNVRSDEEIIRYLQQANRVTFITRNVSDFFHRRYCHPRYCLLCLDVGAAEAAEVTLQVLRHPLLSTIAKRMGKVIRATKERFSFWDLSAEKPQHGILKPPPSKRNRRRRSDG